MSFTIREYRADDPADAQRVADMFNDFDSAWPGGFTRGTLETAKSVREHIDRSRRLAIFVAEDTASGELLGFCDLDAQAGQKEKSYVGLLGARLSAHGKGVGKGLILAAVRHAAAEGYREVTLYTWAGNTKAVPLYKKTGFNWVPDTDVYMRNFIPSALAAPAVREFLDGRDWYPLHQRDLTVAPDDTTWKGMKVYQYRFADDQGYVHVVFQADSAGLTSVDTPAFAVSCTVPVEEAAAGMEYPVVWEIVPRSKNCLNVTLLAEGDPGLDIRVQEQMTITGRTEIARTVRVAKDAEPRRAGQRTHLVRSTLLIDGKPVMLETGVNVVRPIEIQYGGQGLFHGRSKRICVVLYNRLDMPVEGWLNMEPHPALNCVETAVPFNIGSRSWTQCAFEVTAAAPGCHDTQLRCRAISTVDREHSADPPERDAIDSQLAAISTGQPPALGREIETVRPISFRAFSGSETRAGVDATYSEMATLEAADIRIEMELRGGGITIFAADREEHILHVRCGIGPPFGSSGMRPPLAAATVEPVAGGSRLRIVAPPDPVSGIVLERTVTIAGAGLVRIDHRLVNTSARSQTAGVRLRAGGSLDGMLAAPTSAGLIREPLRGSGEFPQGERDLIADGAQLTENWFAREADGFAAGLVWQGTPKQTIDWEPLPVLTFDAVELAVNASVELPPCWAVVSRGDWAGVRSWWNRLVQPAGTDQTEEPVPLRVLSISGDPAPLLLRESAETVTLVVENRRGKELSGALRLGPRSAREALTTTGAEDRKTGKRGTAPNGGTAGEAFQIEPATSSISAVNRDQPFRTVIAVSSPDAPSASILEAVVESKVLSERLRLPIVRIAGCGRIAITEPDPETVTLDNGYFTLRLATRFFGALTGMETGGVNHLLTAYPTPKPFVWMNPWFGGVHPFIGSMGDPDLVREVFGGQRIEVTGERGWQWQGIRMACDLQHKHRSWLRVELDYLTLPGSNVLALVLRHTNGTDARRSLKTGVAAWAQPGGTRENTVLHWERAGEPRLRRRGGFGADGESGCWSAVQNPNTGDSLILVAAEQGHNAAWQDFREEGVHLQARGRVSLSPNETCETLYWLVHTLDVSQAEAYGAALSAARRLP